MKKKWMIAGLALIALALVLFLPIPQGVCEDGGTRVYAALTYKIVVWNKIMDEVDENREPVHHFYRRTTVFWYPDNQKKIDALWELEEAKNRQVTNATTDGPVQLHPLYKKYPEYFDLEDMKGIEVYLWKVGDAYYCGALSGTNRNKTEAEIQALMGNGATIEEMKTILSLCQVRRYRVCVILVEHPFSGFFPGTGSHWDVEAGALFWGA